MRMSCILSCLVMLFLDSDFQLTRNYQIPISAAVSLIYCFFLAPKLPSKDARSLP